jgi:hypothetical protein
MSPQRFSTDRRHYIGNASNQIRPRDGCNRAAIVWFAIAGLPVCADVVAYRVCVESRFHAAVEKACNRPVPVRVGAWSERLAREERT